MKVYIVEGHVDYEGFEILGVFAYKKAAEARVETEKNKDGIITYDHYEITEHEINQSYRWLKL